MKPLHKQTLIAYFLPIISALIVLPSPDYDPLFAVITLVIYLLSFFIPAILYWKYRHRRKKDIVCLLTLKYILYLFFLYFTFPLLKILAGNLLIQLALIAFYIAIPYLARYDQNTKVPIVFPGTDKKHKKITFVYYAIPLILIWVGSGGNHIILRQLSDTIGYSTFSMILSIDLYLFACWLHFFISSFIYKSHVKEGVLNR